MAEEHEQDVRNKFLGSLEFLAIKKQTVLKFTEIEIGFLAVAKVKIFVLG